MHRKGKPTKVAEVIATNIDDDEPEDKREEFQVEEQVPLDSIPEKKIHFQNRFQNKFQNKKNCNGSSRR